jgi:DNA-directed RNA polymerase I, II, and III subunit RPABC2
MSDSESDNESLIGSDSDTSIDNTPITKKINIGININPLNNNLGDDDNDLDDDDELPDDDEEEEEDEDGDEKENFSKIKKRIGQGFDNDVDIEADYENVDDDEEVEEGEEDDEPSRKKSKGKQSVNLGNQNVNNSFDLNYDENDDEDEDEEDDDENYLQKFNKDINKSYINEFHPECIIHNYEEVSAMSHVVRDKDGIIIDDLHKTIPFLTKYERARILGQRAKQIECGSRPFVKVPENIVDSYIIAELELKQKKIPFVIRRPIPGGGCEYWNIKDLEIVHF